ncbi:hypothetical protein [Clostridium sp. Marseille-QA1073]
MKKKSIPLVYPLEFESHNGLHNISYDIESSYEKKDIAKDLTYDYLPVEDHCTYDFNTNVYLHEFHEDLSIDSKDVNYIHNDYEYYSKY